MNELRQASSLDSLRQPRALTSTGELNDLAPYLAFAIDRSGATMRKRALRLLKSSTFSPKTHAVAAALAFTLFSLLVLLLILLAETYVGDMPIVDMRI